LTKNKKVAIIQSNYIPWKGYFDIINSVDEFIILDDVQYTKQDWRNRNKIKTSNGTRWLTIPVLTHDRCYQKIKDTKIADVNWGKRHWDSIRQCYSQAPHFKAFRNIFEGLYLNSPEVYLSEINFKFIQAINKILGIVTPVFWSNVPESSTHRSQRLLLMCQKAGANEYVSGPSAKDYLDVDVFQKEGIKVIWADYSGYPEYLQQSLPFDHAVSVIDLIFNAGDKTPQYMKSFVHNNRVIPSHVS
jgi:WbqC-like protein family